MCMATFIPAGIDIPYEGLENGSFVNDDGHGWAVASPDGLEVGKSMDFTEAIVGLDEARVRHGKSSLALFHSRFATHGTKDIFNTHPFNVDDDTVVAHNGVLPAFWLPEKGDKRSDTRVLTDKTMPHYLSETGVPSRRAGKMLGKLIGDYNKLVVLTARDGQPRVRIINAHKGTHADGVWYSNDGYLPSQWQWRSWRKSDPWKGDDIFSGSDTLGLRFSAAACEVCRDHYSIDLDTGWCDTCDSCSGCWRDTKDCDCFGSPNSKELVKWDDPDEEFASANRAASLLLDLDGLDFGPVVGPVIG